MHMHDMDDTAYTVSVILPAAGESTRMGGATRKPLLTLRDEPILVQTCRRLHALDGVTELIVAAHPDDIDALRTHAWDALAAAGVSMIVAGGANRAASVWNALSACDPSSDLVAVHDAVRPFPDPRICRDLFRTADEHGAAIPIVPVSDTLKRIEGDRITETVRREGLVQVQTPQVFRRELLIEANEYVRRTGGYTEAITDDASIVEACGKEVRAVLSSETNLKITTPRDLARAEAYLQAGLV